MVAVARLTRFEGRGHKKFPKGPPFAYVFEKIQKQIFKGGSIGFFSPPPRFDGGPWPPGPPPQMRHWVVDIGGHCASHDETRETVFIFGINSSAALIFGSVPERTRFVPAVVFVLIWTTFVYDIIAYWSWADHGWIRNLACIPQLTRTGKACFQGLLDFAGGGPVHVRLPWKMPHWFLSWKKEQQEVTMLPLHRK